VPVFRLQESHPKDHHDVEGPRDGQEAMKDGIRNIALALLRMRTVRQVATPAAKYLTLTGLRLRTGLDLS
jgi:hypothetical protein